MPQLNELYKIRRNAYENAKINKEKTKVLHDQAIVRKSANPLHWLKGFLI